MTKSVHFWLQITAVVLLILMAVAAFLSPEGAWPLSLAAIVCVFLANIDRFSEITASTSGVSATLRDAKNKVADLQNIIDVMAEAQIFSLQSSGRWGGGSEEEKEKFFQRLLTIMKDAGIDSGRIKEIRQKNWDRYYIDFDYVHSILGGSTTPMELGKDIIEEWKSLRDFNNVPTPQRVRQFLDKVGDHDEERRKLLAGYEYYVENRKHQDTQAWHQRHKMKKVGKA